MDSKSSGLAGLEELPVVIGLAGGGVLLLLLGFCLRRKSAGRAEPGGGRDFAMKNVLQRSPWRESECAFEVAPSEIVSCTPCVRPFQQSKITKVVSSVNFPGVVYSL